MSDIYNAITKLANSLELSLERVYDSRKLLEVEFQKPKNYYYVEENAIRGINLSSNKIADTSPIGEFKDLTILNLYTNEIEDASHLHALTALHSLQLGLNRIEDIRFLMHLSKLHYLNLVSCFKSSDVTQRKIWRPVGN